MKSVLLTGINGTVAYVMQKELMSEYDVSGVSLVRMDEVMQKVQATTWKEQLDAFRAAVTEQMTTAMEGKTAVVHLGWNTRDEYWREGLDPLNVFAVDCIYRAAIAVNVPRIYMTSSVHAYDFNEAMRQDGEPIPPFPDTRVDPFGVGATSLYGTSKRWMEIAGQFYAKQLNPGQKILVVRLGGVGRNETPHRQGSRLWDSHRDCAGLLRAFIECDAEAPDYWVAFGVSNNHGGEHPKPLFDTVNPYGFTPQDNSNDLPPRDDER